MNRNIVFFARLSLALLSTMAFPSRGADASGRWKGVIELPAGKLAFSVALTNQTSGWGGTMDIPAQGVAARNLKEVRANAASVHFVLPNVPGDPTWDGRFSPDGQSISGDFKQGSAALKFSMTRATGQEIDPGPDTSKNAKAGQGLEGRWQGTLELGAVSLRLVWNIEKAKDNRVSATLDSPDQNARNIPVDSITYEKGVVEMQLPALAARYHAKMDSSKNKMEGTWEQAGGKHPLAFAKAAPESKPARP